MKTENYFKRIILDEVDSTNNYASKMIKDEDIPACITAKYQFIGKGQHGNSWVSEKGMNLLASFVVSPHAVTAATSFFLSKATALAVSECLSARIPNVLLKWPNDLLAGYKKIGGILIENTLSANRIIKSVIGVGLNVNQENFSGIQSEIQPTSLKIELGTAFDPEEILNEMIENLKFWLDEIENMNFRTIDEEYLRMLFGYQEWRTYEAGNHRFEAMISGVKEDGPLILETRKGEFLEFAFKEVSQKLS